MKCNLLVVACLCAAAWALPVTSAFAAGASAPASSAMPRVSTQIEPTNISSAPNKPPVLTRDLITLIQQHKLTELRTIYNGPFAAALFFDPENIEYYVALLKHNEFWWISRTPNGKDAEVLYSKMATQTIQLAAPSLEKMQLDARIAQTRRQLAEAQQKQAELSEQVSTQSRIVQAGTAAQAQLSAQAQQLAEQRAQLQHALTAVNSTIQTLQTETSNGPDISVAWPDAQHNSRPADEGMSLHSSKYLKHKHKYKAPAAQ
jgi:hypothetical protein